MARVVLSTIGSLGDLNPMLALGLELRSRGHSIVINTLSGYEEKIEQLGLEFHTLRPELDEKDTAMAKRVMDSRKGPEVVVRELMLPSLHETYADLASACQGADLMITGELLFVASSLAQKTGIKWISTSLAPLSMFSSYDPNVYHIAPWLEVLRPLPTFLHQGFFSLSRMIIGSWLQPFNCDVSFSKVCLRSGSTGEYLDRK